MNILRTLILCLAVALPVARVWGATLYAYVESPGTESSSVAGVTTEDFDGLTPGVYTTALSSSIGTYNPGGGPAYAILAANSYGGAGDAGQYFAVGAQSRSTGPVVLSLVSPQNYFGFWWSAGDPNNSISFFNGGSLLATFTTAQLDALLPNTSGSQVMAINGSTYNTQAYYNNPNGGDATEPFAYVDFIATGLTFDQITFSNANTGTGFESDNHSIANGVVGPPPTDVIVGLVNLTTPEPSTWILLGAGLAALGFVRVNKKLRAANRVIRD